MGEVIVSNLHKSFDKKEILSGIDLAVEDKSFCVLLGPSGCGKSTLLRLIAGLEKPDIGEIFIDGKKMNDIPPKDREIAFVFQSYALYPHLSVFDNMAFPLKIRGVDKKNIEKKVFEKAEMLGLLDLLKRKPKELSGGQRQRVALGRAIVREAKVFLMDEPLSNLDAKLRANMRVEIKKLHKELNSTFIYVTHDQTEALTMGDFVVILNEGKIFQKDTPDNVFKRPKNTFVASFSGTYPMNLIEGNVYENRVNISGVLDFFANIGLSPRKKIIAGIRPENIKLSYTGNSDDYIKQKFQITFIENTGAIRVLHIKNNDIELKAIVGSNDDIEEYSDFYINKNDFIFFDADTKELI